MNKVTKKQAEAVLTAVAEWMGTKGYGTPICPDGKPLSGIAGMQHPDGTWCEGCKFGPAPTGPNAAYRGEGPELRMDWDWANAPSVILEGGPDEWAIACSFAVQQAMDAKKVPVYVEPYASWALSIYPK